MMEGTDDASSKPVPANELDLDLYTIPSYSSWFSWDEIHETERASLKEFFDGSSISRTPKVYKEYRDFIISKYREEPSRRLTFTEVRKSLIGDVSLLQKVFRFLERWGLINFSASSPSDDHATVREGDDRLKVRFEEGAPNGVRVVAVPNSSKIVSLPPIASDHGEVVENGFRLPPLASYSDVFGDLIRHKGYVCGNCGEDCGSGYYKSTKGSFLVCVKCFKDGKYGESNSIDDFKFNDFTDGSGNPGTDGWTDAETIILLESVLKHGDDWDLVAQNVQTKSKLDCISRLIQLPFGDLMLGISSGKDDGQTNGNTAIDTQVCSNSIEPQEPIKTEDQSQEDAKGTEKIRIDETRGSPLKRQCVAAGSGSLMEKVALLSTMVGPHVATAAADAAFTILYDESQFSKDFFEGGEDDVKDIEYPLNSEPERVPMVEDSGIGVRDSKSDIRHELVENSIPLTFRIRAAIGTAIGAAAAHAKLFADQEDKEIEHLMAIIIEAQLRKMHCKIKHFEELELIMEKEYAQIEELKKSIAAERIDILRRIFNAGISRWKDHPSVKCWTGTVF